MTYIVFLGVVLGVGAVMNGGLGSIFLLFVAITLVANTVITMLSAKLVGETPTLMEALRASMLSFSAVVLVSAFTLKVMINHSPLFGMLWPVLAFIAATWAVSHALSLTAAYAAMICLINGLIMFALLKSTAFLPLLGSAVETTST